MSDGNDRAPLPPLEQHEAESVPEGAADTVGNTSDAAAQAVESTTGAASAFTTKPDVGKRVLAYIIDWVIAMVLYAVLAPLSAPLASLVGAAYLLFRDGLDFDFMRGRSLGKRMMKLTVERDDGGKMDLATSARRNWPVALSMLPLGLLWLILAPVSLVIGIVEAYLVLTSPDGRRWGDKMAGTRPVETGE